MTPDARNREGQREVRLILEMREFEQERRRVSERHGDKVAAIILREALGCARSLTAPVLYAVLRLAVAHSGLGSCRRRPRRYSRSTNSLLVRLKRIGNESWNVGCCPCSHIAV